MKNKLSAYGINNLGLLYYSGLPTDSNNITFDEHNPIDGKPISRYTGKKCKQMQYEIYAIGKYGFLHGIYDCEKFGYIAVRLSNCWVMAIKRDINK